jgi:dihydrofolate reductase
MSISPGAVRIGGEIPLDRIQEDGMGKVIAFELVTLDGVMQAPGRPDEDRRGGFEHGGWAGPYAGAENARFAQQGTGNTGALLLGRRTYEDFYDYWPKQKDNPFTTSLNNNLKYVASTTLRKPLAWQNSVLLEGDVAEGVRRLKQDPKDLVILGSGELVRSLMSHNLVDEFLLLIHPLVLGCGQRLFPDGGTPINLELVKSSTTSTGVVIATYRTAVTSGGTR